MAKDNAKSSFIYYHDWAKSLLSLPDDLRLRIDDAVKRYVLYGEEPQEKEILYSMFWAMRQRIDEDSQKWRERCDKNRKAANERWENKSEANASNRMQMHKSEANASNRMQMHKSDAIYADNDKEYDKEYDNESTKVDIFSFDEFWVMYDKKVNRSRCEKKWHTLSDAKKDAIKAALPKYIESTPDKQYRKNPLTYLNGECWNDEIIPVSHKSSVNENRKATPIENQSGNDYHADKF